MIYNKNTNYFEVFYMKKFFAIGLLLVVFFSFCSCGNVEKGEESSNLSEQKATSQGDRMQVDYISTKCKDTQVSTKISVVDGKVYRFWTDVTKGEEGFYSEYSYILDVFENGSWKNISTSQKENDDGGYFDKVYKYPLNEKVGNKTVYTDDKNDFYLRDENGGKPLDLGLNLENWRAFATDGESVFAVLSATADKNCEHEIRIYDITKIK